MHSRILLRPAALLLGMFSFAPAHAQVGGAWVDLGPGPSHAGQVEGITNREVVGAVNAIAPHPSNADILYVGGVNGGIWSTANATAAAPTWTRLTDTLGSQSIGSLEIDPTDATRQTLLAGTARSSSLGGVGGAHIGLLRSTNAGGSWSVLTGGTLNNVAIVGVAGRGATIVVATAQGIFRSTDTGGVFTQISGAVGSGIPLGATSDLSGDPTNTARLYTAVRGATPGLYRSTDTGVTWTKVSDAAIDAVIAAGNGSPRIELAVGASGQVFAAIVSGVPGATTNGRLADVFRSADGVTGWTSLGVPTTTEEGAVTFGVHAGGQGGTHLSIAADPTDANIVYIGGDRQPYFGEGVPGSQLFFPNSIGANDYSGRLFRGDATQPPATRWLPITHLGAANNSSPHADSRDMAFDAQGNLLESDDGGIYKRVSPKLPTGAWFSLNGNLQTTEYHGIAYDAVANRTIGGAQDTGTTEQRNTSTRIFDSVSTGDGGDPVVEDRSSTTESTRYTSFQFLQQLRRRTFNASNQLLATAFPARTPINGSVAITAQFYCPLAVNDADGLRLLIGAQNGVFESLTRGDTVERVATVQMNGVRGSPVVYGVPGNADLIYFGSTTGLFLRTALATGVQQVNTLATTVSDVAIDRDAPARLFALTATTVHFSSNSGALYGNITGNLLTSFTPGTLRSMAFIAGTDDALIVGTDRGAYVAFDSTGFATWAQLGTGLPNVPVFELEYDVTDNVLVAGTLGRGAWSLNAPTGLPNLIFRGNFE